MKVRIDPEPLRLSDGFGRQFPYLRLSVTDVCNFRCTYCLPDGYKAADCDTFLSKEELLRAVRAFVGLGVWKIRLTGGEPTVRPDFLELAEAIAATPGVKKIALTTNGYKLDKKAGRLFDAGIRAVNVSVDSLDDDVFHNITGHNRLKEVLAGIDACLELGMSAVKLNTVLLKGLNDNQLGDFLAYIKDKPVSLRFIELMETLDNPDYFKQHHLSGSVIQQQLEHAGWREQPRLPAAGPAREFAHPQSKGTIGLIMPYSKDFCETCNRLRFSAKGALHLCLFGSGGHSLRHLLQDDSQQPQLEDAILSLMDYKKSAHFLHDGNSGATPHLASIGG